MRRFIENDFLYYLILSLLWSIYTAFSFAYDMALSRKKYGSLNEFQYLELDFFFEDFLLFVINLFFVTGVSTILLTAIINYIIMNKANRRQIVSHGSFFLLIIALTIHFFSITFFMRNLKQFLIGYILTLATYTVLQYFKNKLVQESKHQQ